jgi:hypothetical protein
MATARVGPTPVLRVLLSALLVAVATLGSSSAAVVAGPPRPGGIFSMAISEQPVAADVLSHPYVKGVSLRQRWSTFESADGLVDHAYLDAQLQRIAAAGKVAHVRVMHGGTSIPGWVLDASGQIFVFTDNNRLHDTYHQQVVIPVPWDSTYLQLKTRAIAALGAHLNANPTVAYVGVACANAYSDDWFIPTTARDITNWLAAGYTTEKMLGACMRVIDATAAAFPDKVMAMAVGPTSAKLDPDVNYLARSLVAYARSRYPGRFIAQKNTLSATVADPAVSLVPKQWKLLLDNRPDVAGQMLWYATDDAACRLNGNQAPCDPVGVLQDAIATGAHYGMQYIEIYQRDVRNAAMDLALRYGADALSVPTVPTGLTGEVVSSTRIHLFWSPATDEVAVEGYRIYRGGNLVGVSYTRAFADTSVRGGRSYTYRVSAFDATGNESARSAPLTLTTP